MHTTSARKATHRSGPPIAPGLILAGLGMALVAASLYLQYAGPAVWRGTLTPARTEGGRGVFATPELELPGGTYTMHLGFRRPSRALELSTGYFGVDVSCEAHPAWHASGSLRRLKTRSRWARISGTVVLRIVRPLHAPLLLEVDGASDATLSVTIRRSRLDHRIPLALGLVLAAAGLLIDPSTRAWIPGLTGRS